MLQTFFIIFIYLNMSTNNGLWHDHLKYLEFLKCSVHLYKVKSNLSEDEIVAVLERQGQDGSEVRRHCLKPGEGRLQKGFGP